MQTEVDQLCALMLSYARGRQSAFEPLYRLIAPRLNRFCLRLAADRTEAEDVLQETFLRLHRARATYIAGANVLHWAFAIARSAFIDRVRYRRRRPEDLGAQGDVAEDQTLRSAPGRGPEDALVTHELQRVVTLELDRMSEKSRVAYVLMREEGLSAKDAAEILGTTPDVVKQRAHRAYDQIRAAVCNAGWREYEDDPPQIEAAVRV
jgi:RNA polymerase sigma-70 factor, ECF subfamily